MEFHKLNEKCQQAIKNKENLIQFSIEEWYYDQPKSINTDIQYFKQMLKEMIEINESNMLLEYKKNPTYTELLINQMSLISIYSRQKECQDEIRNSKALRTLLRLIKINIESQETKILYSLLNMIAAITARNNKNVEYILIKKGHELIKITIQISQLKQISCIIFANFCIGSDQRLLLWAQGIFNFIIKQTISEKKVSQEQLLFVWRILSDNQEILDDFIQIYKDTQVFQLSPNPLIIAISRKLAEANQEINKQNLISYLFLQNQNPFFYKELLALIAIVVINNPELLKGNIKKILELILLFQNDLRVVKSGIGCLTNLSANQKLLEELGAEKQFYQILLQILDNQYDKNQLIDYCLKLFLNSLNNQVIQLFILFYSIIQVIQLQLSQPRFVMKLLFIWHNQQYSNETMIRIFRTLLHNNSQGIISCIEEIQNQDVSFRFIDLIIQNIEKLFKDKKFIQAGDAFILVAEVSQISKQIKIKKQLIDLAQQYVETMKQLGEENFKRARQIVSALPIEDL